MSTCILFLASQHDIISIFVNYRKKVQYICTGNSTRAYWWNKKIRFLKRKKEKDRKEKGETKEDGILIRYN